MTKNLFSLLLILVSTSIFSQSFNSIWNTTNTSSGSSADNEITIPTNPAYTNYNYSVNWGDGQTDTGVTGDITHTYATQGTYTLMISGDFPAIYFNNVGDKLKIIEILDWGTIQWQSMENAFYGCENLNFDAINSPDLSQVTSLKNMFKGGVLFNGIVNNWDVSTVTDISGIFHTARIFNRPLDNWNTAAVTDMSFAFHDAQLFNEPLDSWNTAAVTTMENMFYNADNFNQNINNWNVANVTNMVGLFYSAGAFNQPLNNWSVNNVTNMSRMFASSTFNQPINNWVVDNVTDMSQMFSSGGFNQPLDGWNVSNVTNMASMFGNSYRFNQPLNNWDVSSVTDMSEMFGGSGSLQPFNQPLDQWDVSSVTDMQGMFASSMFNQPINNWDVSNVTDMSEMFSGWATSYTVFDQPLNNWDVSKVTDMSEMFEESNFNQDISAWDVSSVTTIQEMFNSAQRFNQPLNNWTFGGVTSISRMFASTPAFNQPLNNWNTAAIINMSQAFSNALAFDQNLASWNIANVTNMSTMLSNSGLSQENYDDTLIGWAAQTVTAGISLGANTLQYCDGLSARQDLIDNHGWNITGDAVNCSNVFCTTMVNPVASDTNVPANSNIRWAAAPNANGYYVTLELERGGVRNYVNINGNPANNYDVGNVQILQFTNEFDPGDTVYITVTPYNDEGPAVDCEEFSFTTVASWVNSPAAYKIKIDTRLGEPVGNIRARQFEMERNTSYTYNYAIDWGDNEYNNNVSNDITHTYNIPGEYTIAIIGDFPAPYFGTFGDGEKVLSIEQWGTHEYQSMRRACYECENMVYNATDIPNLSQVTDMSQAFAEASLFNGNIDNWDVSNVTNMSEMFERAELFNQPLNSWDVSNVTNMYRMFDGFVRFMDFNQPLNNWDVSNVTNMGLMFRRTEFFNQPLDNWNVGNVTNMWYMFSGTTAFNQDINVWDVSSVENMSFMFSQAAAFNSPLDSWDVNKVTNMSSMFSRSTSFNQPINVWDVSSVTNMESMFESAENFNRPLNSWDVDNVTNMAAMFKNSFLFNQPLANWDVSRVTTMQSMFNGAKAFNQPLENWNVNSVVNMQSMFESAEAFNQPLNAWNVSAVANMSSMFKQALIFDQPLNSWDVSSVTLMRSMFEGAAIFNNAIGNWDVGSVTNMNSMFEDATVFNQPIQNWDTGEVLNMEEMFKGASAFNRTIDSWDVSFVTTMKSMFENAVAYDQTMNSWNVASVITMEKMFKGATAFNSDIDAWNVRGVDTMFEMFSGATAFNQSVNNWRVSGVSNMNNMFYGASAYNQTMDLWNLGNVSMRSAFYNATALNQDLGAWDVSGVTDMRDMLDNTALIRENYDNTLIAWSEQTLTSGITLGAEGLPYCDALEERQSMIDNFGWTFSLDVRDCPIPECTQLTSPRHDDTDVPVNTNITWEHAQYARGYYLTVGTSPGGNDIEDNITINDETSYEFAADFNTGDEVYVTITPFNDEGDSGVCIEERFTISNDPATIPFCTNLTEPLNNAPNVSVTTDLSWDPISNADGYKLILGSSTGANDILDAGDIGNVVTYDLPTDLPEDSDIFVTITPYNDQGDATCTSESFHTEVIPVPPVCTTLTNPSTPTDVPIDTNLSWNAIANATGYLVVVGTTSDGIEVANNIDVGSATTYDFLDDLEENRLYYVTIIPYNDVGDATGCIEETFRTGDSTSPPSCTELTNPANLATGISPGIDLSWNAITSATGYNLTVGTTSGGTDIFNSDVNNVTTYDLTTDLPQSTPIYVTVTPYNDNGIAIGPCSEVRFTTDGPPLCTTLNSPSNNDPDVPFDLGSITWNASTNATGYTLTITANSSTANNGTFDITSGTTHPFANDFERGETVTVSIIPYNTVGAATGPCVSESFTIIPPPVPACTTLSSPLTDVALRPTIEWNASTGANRYELTVTASNSTINNVIDRDIPTGTTYTFTNDFEQGETVDVTIVPYNDQGAPIGCTAETISIKPVPSCTDLFSPEDKEVNVAKDISRISWNAVSDASQYRVSVSAENSTANNISNTLVTGETYDFQNDFTPGELVTVTIIPLNESGDAIDCETKSFTIKPLPACTNLTAPENDDIDIAVDTNIEWRAIAEADGYLVTINASNSTANNGTFDITSGTTHNPDFNFEQGETVDVTIITYNEVGQNTNCMSESFTIKPIPLCTDLTDPENQEVDVAVDTNLEWRAIADANGYLVTVDASNSTGNNGTFDITSGTSHNPDFNFEQGETVTVTITPYNEVGEAMNCTSESFTIKSVPVCTNLLSPRDEDIVADVNELTWNEIVDADGYKLTIRAEITTSNDETDLIVTGTSHIFQNDFDQGEIVTVTIIPFNEVGDAIGPCVTESFTIRPIPPCTNLVDLLNSRNDIPIATDISWNPSFDADGYRISVGTSPNGTDIVNDEDVASLTSYTLSDDLPSETLIYVTITPYNSSGDAAGCTSGSFETEVVIPECSTISSPFNGETEVDLESTIIWDEIEKTDGYRISIGTTSGGTDIVNDLELGTSTSYNHNEEYPFGREIFVTVIAYNTAGDAVQCEEQSFTTLIPEDNTKYGFSPDGDGINEYWHIENIEYYPANVVTIYNRWGDTVFRIENYDNGSEVFRGEANMKTKMGAGTLPSGTYFFDIQIEGETILQKTKGYVVIKR
ncbi:BspA family leucine-rich repeat surface protein [Maribacter sp. 2308TA10-17]|uniref:BspA family leucine-rich repeat surface protein n=1 Tax=Maribacter sp. 2308TA10-17 TaxID=3386276 RepID=UPI0039BD1CF0